MDIHALVEEKISADADFQAELELLSDEERNQALADRKAELVKQEFDAIATAKAKAEEIARNQKIRAEKAEQERKVAQPAVAPADTKTAESLSLSDIRALNDVHDDDVEHITKYAKFAGVTIAEAKKLPEMQAYIKTRNEERKSAEVANSGGSRRAVTKNTGQAILERVAKGELPESDDDIQALAEARLAEKIAKAYPKQ